MGSKKYRKHYVMINHPWNMYHMKIIKKRQISDFKFPLLFMLKMTYHLLGSNIIQESRNCDSRSDRLV